MDGVPLEIRPGYAGFTPPGAEMAYRFVGHSVHVFAHLEWPRDAEPSAPLPMMFPVGPSFALLWERLEEAVGWFHHDPLRAEVRAWDVLLALADASKPGSGLAHLPRPVQDAMRIIEERLGEPLSVEAIAREVCVSHNHLSRLFRSSTGSTVIGTIQKRRVERARHLLEFSTLPIKEVATMVGLPDLQQFNKTVRQHLGVAPSFVRKLKVEG